MIAAVIGQTREKLVRRTEINLVGVGLWKGVMERYKPVAPKCYFLIPRLLKLGLHWEK